MIKKYFQNQIDEISVDPVLRVYGFFLSLLIPLTAFHWSYYHLENWLIHDVEAICWPMFESCRSVRMLGVKQLQILFYVLGFFGLGTSYLFLKSRWTKVAWTLLVFLNVIKYLTILMDYRMRLNQHIMAFWIMLVFLLLPDKKKTLKVLIILLYFWAGVIKIDPEWLSGSALYIKPWLISEALIPWSCVYVVILEIIFIWALLWSRSWMAWLTFVQLLIFHIFSFGIVGFFYPMVMFGIISLFPIDWISNHHQIPLIKEFQLDKKIPYTVLFLIFIFSFFQILPKTFPGETSVTGEGRLLALHMFDSLNSCNVRVDIRMKEGKILHQNLYLPLAPRIRCDPVVYLSRARYVCYKNRSNKHFENIDLFLETKRSTESIFQPVVDIHDFCTQQVRYSFFSTNDWILKTE